MCFPSVAQPKHTPMSSLGTSSPSTERDILMLVMEPDGFKNEGDCRTVTIT